jgi:site-specific recombinase XerD
VTTPNSTPAPLVPVPPAPPVSLEVPPSAAPRQAETDEQLVGLWLFGRSPHTVRAYRREAGSFLAFLGARGRGLTTGTLGDLQAYADGLAGLAPASRQRALAAVKSLLTFGQRVGYLPVNVGAAVKLPPVRDALAERLLARERVTRLIALEPDPRDRALLLVLYVGGLRISEAVALRRRDLRPRDDPPGAGGQLAVQGKGDKTRYVLLPVAVWRELAALCGLDGPAGAPGAEPGDAVPDAPVFRSKRSPGPLDVRTARRVVKAAARRAGLPEGTSPHWLRHAHASHALDARAPVHLVRDTLGHASLATTSRYAHARPGDSSALHLGY